ncbi:MAG: metallophosphatase family protein [Oscillospiraceae bacterium]|nr:metallophosphatase family protein [Oscillospiraceae bacterium]
MKFAVISDIHGNIVALRAVLAEIERERVDHLLVLGDLFSSGHVQDILTELRGRDAVIIRGNNEDYQLEQNLSDWEGHDQFEELAATRRDITPQDMQWIAALPAQVTLTYPDVSLRLMHIEAPADETITLCGHTHRNPFVREENGRYICNTGSVGENFDPAFTADVTFITCQGSNITFEQRRVPYDFEAWRHMTGSTLKQRLNLRAAELGRNLFMEFLAEADHGLGWPIPNDIWRATAKQWQERGLL